MSKPKESSRSAAGAVQSLAFTLSILPAILLALQRAGTWRIQGAGGKGDVSRGASAGAAPYSGSGSFHHPPPCGIAGSHDSWKLAEICSPPPPVPFVIGAGEKQQQQEKQEEEVAQPPSQVPNHSSAVPPRAEPPKQQPPEDQRRYAPSPAPAPYWMRRSKAQEGTGIIKQRTRKYTVPARAA